MRWLRSERNNHFGPTIPGGWLNIRYIEALSILFRIENSLRLYVFCLLKENLGAGWRGVQVADPGGESKSIAQIAKQRATQMLKHGYVSRQARCDLAHLTLGQLVSLILDDKQWKFFGRHFRADKQVIKHKLLELAEIRNALTHFRVITDSDIDRLRLNATDTLGGVEAYLNTLVLPKTELPSNETDAGWDQQLVGKHGELVVRALEHAGRDLTSLTIEHWSHAWSAIKAPNNRNVRLKSPQSNALLSSRNTMT